MDGEQITGFVQNRNRKHWHLLKCKTKQTQTPPPARDATTQKK